MLHVGFSNPLTGEIALKATEVLRISHPGLAVEICEVPLSDPFGQLRNGAFDVQLQEFPVREDDLSGGPALLSEGRVLAVSSAHPLSARESVSMEDLADVLLLTIEGELPDYWLERHVPPHTPGGRPVAHGPAVTHMQEALMLVAGGRGALLTAAHTTTYYTRPGIVYLPFVDAEPVGYGLVWRSGSATGALEAFAGATREVVAKAALVNRQPALPGAR